MMANKGQEFCVDALLDWDWGKEALRRRSGASYLQGLVLQLGCVESSLLTEAATAFN